MPANIGYHWQPHSNHYLVGWIVLANSGGWWVRKFRRDLPCYEYLNNPSTWCRSQKADSERIRIMRELALRDVTRVDIEQSCHGRAVTLTYMDKTDSDGPGRQSREAMRHLLFLKKLSHISTLGNFCLQATACRTLVTHHGLIRVAPSYQYSWFFYVICGWFTQPGWWLGSQLHCKR